MAFYFDEEEVWKCPKHPSKRRRSGICPSCLRDRLGNLCPDCANVRPCTCSSANNSSSSSSSSSSSFLQRFSSVRESSSSSSNPTTGLGRVSNLIDSEPSFTRSRSVAIRFLRSRFADHKDSSSGGDDSKSSSSSSFWSSLLLFKSHHHNKKMSKKDGTDQIDDNKNTMRRSKSVISSSFSSSYSSRSHRDSCSRGAKGTKGGWYFASPFRQSSSTKVSKVGEERSPLCKASYQ